MSRRWLLGVVGLALTVASVAGSAAGAQSDPATLTIHWRGCPAGVFGPNLYEACHHLAPSGPVTVSLAGAATRTATTDAAGNVVFTDLTPGAYFVGDNRPGGDFTSRHRFCSAAETPGVPRPAGGGAIFLAAGDDVVCDWYIMHPDLSGIDIPTPAPTPIPPSPLPSGTSIVVASWLCSKDYVDSDYAATCRTTPGEHFRYWNSNVTFLEAPEAGADGIVQFDFAGLQTRRAVIGVRPAEGTRDYFAAVVDCAVGDTRLHTLPLSNLSTHHMIAVSVAPGEEVRCDWYNVPYPSD